MFGNLFKQGGPFSGSGDPQGLFKNVQLIDPSIGLPMAAALIGSGNNPQAFSNALLAASYGMNQRRDRRQQEQQRNATLDYLRQNRPDLAEQVQAGLPVSEAFKMINQKPDMTDDIREFNLAQQQGFQGGFMDYMTSLRRAGADRNTSVGNIPQGYQLQQGEDGSLRMVPVPGGPADTSIEDAKRQESQQTSANIVLDEIDIAKQIIGSNPGTTTGVVGSVLSTLDQTAAGALKNRLQTIKANIGFDKLQAMRDASPTGGALGQVSEFENRLLQSVYGSLAQAQDPADIMYNLDRLEGIYNRIINEGIPDEEARQLYRQEALRGAGVKGGGQDGEWTIKEVE